MARKLGRSSGQCQMAKCQKLPRHVIVKGSLNDDQDFINAALESHYRRKNFPKQYYPIQYSLKNTRDSEY